jgi:HEAT repeat protein
MSQITGIVLSVLVSAHSSSSPQARELVDRLRSEKVEDRDDAASKLKALGKAAIPELEKASKDPDADLRILALQLLRVIELQDRLSPELRKAFPGLEERLATGDDQVWAQTLLEAISVNEQGLPKHSDLGRWDLEPLMIRALQGARMPGNRKTIVSMAGQVKAYSAIPEILNQIRDPEAGIAAIVALSGLDAWEAVPELRRLLDEKDAPTLHRAAAIRTLGELRAREALPRLLELSSNPDLESAVFQALGPLGAKEGIPTLCNALKSSDPWIPWTAARSLGLLGAPEGIPELLIALRNRNDVFLRGLTAGVLADRGATEAIPNIETLLQEKDVDVLQEAARALGKLGAKGSIPKIKSLLVHENAQVRLSALDALDALKGLETSDLRERLKDSHRDVRVTAAELLAIRGHAEGLPVILQESDVLSALNPLRVPDLWSQLALVKIRRSRSEYSLQEFLEGVAKDAGLRIEAPPDPEGRYLRRMSQRWRERWEGESSVTGGLLWLSGICPYDVVLEPGRIRVLPKSEVRSFWEAWSKREGGREK